MSESLNCTALRAAPRLSIVLACFLVPSFAAAGEEGGAESVPLSNSKASIYAPGKARASQDPIALTPGPHLFLDDFLIAASENVERVAASPLRDASIPNPVITGEEDGCFQPYLTVLRDPASGRFRMWYGHRTDDSSGIQSHIAYMESEDGIRWNRPKRILEDPGPIQFGVSIVDDGPGCPNPAQRYKSAWYHDGGLQVGVSPDGLSWARIADKPLLRHNHDITGLFFDPLRKHYVATLSVYREGEAWPGKRRITMQSHSADLARWSQPHYVITPDGKQDPGETQFYAMDGYLVRGGLMIGMVKVLRDDLKADDPPDPPDAYGVGYTALAWSRDGETWVRDRQHFFDPDPRKGAWDHAHAWIDEQVVVGDDVYLYYGGYARGHKVERFKERQIGVVRIKRDRYIARQTTGDGSITTPSVIMQGTRLTLNADARNGKIEVALLDAGGKPIPGFTCADCKPIHENGVAIPVSWAKPLAEVSATPIQIEIRLNNAAVYGLGIE